MYVEVGNVGVATLTDGAQSQQTQDLLPNHLGFSGNLNPPSSPFPLHGYATASW